MTPHCQNKSIAPLSQNCIAFDLSWPLNEKIGRRDADMSARLFRLSSSSTRIHAWQRRVVALGVLLVAAGSYVYLLNIHQQAIGPLYGDNSLPLSSFKHAAIRPFQEQLQQHRSQQAQSSTVAKQQNKSHETVVTVNTISNDTSSIRIRTLPAKTSNRISFELHDGFTFNNTFNPLVTCNRIDGKRLPLHAEMKNARGVLDFTTHITTDLKILVMGDSVGMQFSQGLEEATGVVDVLDNSSDSSSSSQQQQQHRRRRTVYRYAWGEHEGLHLSAPVRGGGVVAGWRITDFLRAQGQNQPGPNWPGGGWVMDDVEALLQHVYSPTTSLGVETHDDHRLRHTTVDKFDVLVFRIPHGWIELTKITVEALQETVDLAHALFHVSSVVFVSLPFVNNVVEQWQLDMLTEKNALLRDFAQTFNNNKNSDSSSKASGGVQHVSVLEFGRFTDALMEWNAKILGMNTTNNDDWKLEPLRCCPHKGYRRHIAHVCGEAVPRKAPRCDRNAVSYDGMHWCMETIAGRFYAGLSCLLGCVFNRPPGNNADDGSSLASCEEHCNDQYMSLTPIADDVIIKN